MSTPKGIVEGHFRILELSENISVWKLNMEKFAIARDTMINAEHLVLPTILALKSGHSMRFEQQSKVPGNHVTCYWQGQIIDCESKRTYPLTLNNLHSPVENYYNLRALRQDVALFQNHT